MRSSRRKRGSLPFLFLDIHFRIKTLFSGLTLSLPLLHLKLTLCKASQSITLFSSNSKFKKSPPKRTFFGVFERMINAFPAQSGARTTSREVMPFPISREAILARSGSADVAMTCLRFSRSALLLAADRAHFQTHGANSA